MATAVKSIEFDIANRIKDLTDRCRMLNIEKLLSECFENLTSNPAIDYIGELNKNDVMH